MPRVGKPLDGFGKPRVSEACRKRWFFATDSVAKTAGSGPSRWYLKELLEEMGVSGHVEQEISVGFERLAEFTERGKEWVDQADVVWVLCHPLPGQ